MKNLVSLNLKKKSEIDDLLADVEANDSISNQNNPLFDYLVGTGYQGGPVIAQFLEKDQKRK